MTKRPDLPELAEGGTVKDEDRLLDALSGLVLPSRKGPPQLLRERILSTVARPRLRFAPFYSRLRELFDLNDSELGNVFERATNDAEWTASGVPQTELLHLTGGPRAAHADVGLVRIAAGAAFPPHRHLGLERVLVLQGGYRDEPSGQIYRAGDWHEMAAGSSHTYVAFPDGELLLAVSLVGGAEVEGYGTVTGSNR